MMRLFNSMFAISRSQPSPLQAWTSCALRQAQSMSRGARLPVQACLSIYLCRPFSKICPLCRPFDMRRFCDNAYRKEMKLLGAYGGLGDLGAEVCLRTCNSLPACDMTPLPSYASPSEHPHFLRIAWCPTPIIGGLTEQ